MLQGSESLLLSELETSVLTLAVALFVGRTFRAGLIEDSDFVSTELRILLLFEEEEPGLELLCTLLDFLVADGIDVDDDLTVAHHHHHHTHNDDVADDDAIDDDAPDAIDDEAPKKSSEKKTSGKKTKHGEKEDNDDDDA